MIYFLRTVIAQVVEMPSLWWTKPYLSQIDNILAADGLAMQRDRTSTVSSFPKKKNINPNTAQYGLTLDTAIYTQDLNVVINISADVLARPSAKTIMTNVPQLYNCCEVTLTVSGFKWHYLVLKPLQNLPRSSGTSMSYCYRSIINGYYPLRKKCVSFYATMEITVFVEWWDGFLLNRSYPPDGHDWNYYHGALPMSQVTGVH